MKNNQTGELPEVRWARLLRIKTAGRDDSSADQYRYPYEPTPYSVLERLAGSGWIRKGNILLDYGCGKGRVGLFLSCQTRCRSIGVEYDPRIYENSGEPKFLCILWKILLCPGQCRTLCRSLLRRPGLLFQPIFSGASPKGHGPDPKLIL